MLNITFSNRHETLRAALLQALAQDPAGPFVAEQVIVPSAALRRDLTLALSERFGVCANVEFSFLAQWLWRQIGRVVPDVAAESPFASPVLTWRIVQIFADDDFVAGFPRLRRYLEQTDAVARFDFAGKLAALFEQYLTYRPAWLAAWAAGEWLEIGPDDDAVAADQAWQAALWRVINSQLLVRPELVEGLDSDHVSTSSTRAQARHARAGSIGMQQEHPAAVFLRSVARLGEDARQQAGLPESAHLFCLPTIPPLYLHLLRELGRWIDLHLYVLNPCREYWFEIVDQRRLGYLAMRNASALHETGNRLLAAWGKQTQAQIDLLLELAGDAPLNDAGFSAAPDDTLLAHLQNAILDLREMAPASVVLDAADRSLEVHVCHSLTRELEVLQDQLLAMFAGPNPPRPCDIVVVTPDLNAAAPLIEAVFGNAPRDRYMAYSISGRARATENRPARALLDVLALLASRFPASGVFDLLQQPIVARRFGIAEGDLEPIQVWMQQSGIRWGADAQHRQQQGLPALERFSFDDGLQRLWLGYALPDKHALPWLDRLPAGNPEGSAALALGLFAHFVGELSRLRADFAQARTPAGWMRALFDLLDTFLAPTGDDMDDLAEVRHAVRTLHDNMQQGGLSLALDLDVLRAALEVQLDDLARGGVPTGAITFTSISGVRNLPFRIVCAIGLNDGAFPGTTRPLEFDLMAVSPQRGDRQRRLDERNLFLDLVLAARERLYLSYTGRSIRDNAPLPASVLVSELIETLQHAIDAEPMQAWHRLVIEHPLQPFSPQCFAADADVRSRSFNRELCAALQAVPDAAARVEAAAMAQVERQTDADSGEADDELANAAAGASPGRFFQAPLSEPGPEWRQLSLAVLIRLFRHPCRYLLRERLGIELAEAGEELTDDEPFLPDFVGRQALADRLLPACRAGVDDAELRALALAGIEYPTGILGELSLDAELQSLRKFAESVRLASLEACLPPQHARLDFALAGETWQLAWSCAELRSTGLLLQRYDDTRAVDYLDAWLHHLCLCAVAPAEVVLQTRWLSRDGEFRLRACASDAAVDRLQALLNLYRRGLREPIHFFPKAACRYVLAGRNMSQASAAWLATRDRPWGESAHPAYRLALRGISDPLDADFLACAEAVFGEMMDYLEDARL